MHMLKPLPPDYDFQQSEIFSVLPDTRAAIAELKGYLVLLPNPMLLLSPAVIKESLASSEIENIQTTLASVLEQSLFPEAEQITQNKEVLHYREAIYWGAKGLNEFGLSDRLILGIAARLLPAQQPAYRKVQNQIANITTKKMIYTPPAPQNIPDLIHNWQKYANDAQPVDPLIQVAVCHYQFEAIHPLLDGNGRTGRILMVLQMISLGLLDIPVFYISRYINENKQQYYALLSQLNDNAPDAWSSYIVYMLKAMKTQAIETRETVFEILQLFNALKQNIQQLKPRLARSPLLEQIFAYPVITPMQLSENLGIHYTTATRQLKELVDAGILSDRFEGKYHLFINTKLIQLLTTESKI